MQTIPLDWKKRKLLKILYESPRPVTAKRLAEQIRVTDRTVCNYVNSLNKYLRDYEAEIIGIHREGYVLRCTDRDKINQLIASGSRFLSERDRGNYILYDLICGGEGRSLGEYEDQMFVSFSTMEKDIRYIKANYSESYPFLKIKISKGKVALEDNEVKKREILIHILEQQVQYTMDFELPDYMYFLSKEELYDIANFVKSVLAQQKMRTDDAGLAHIVLTIAVSVFRDLTGNTLMEKDDENTEIHLDADIQMREILAKLSSFVNTYWNLQFVEEERKIIRDAVSSQCILAPFSFHRNSVPDEDRDAAEAVGAVLDEMSRVFGMELNSDSRLYNQLLTNIIMLRHYYVKPMDSQYDILSDIQHEIPMIVAWGWHFYRKVRERIDVPEVENALTMLVEPFSEATDAMQRKQNEIQVIAFVTNINYTRSKFLLTKLKACFPDIFFAGPFFAHEKVHLEKTRPSAVITTFDAKDWDMNIPVVSLDPSLQESDIFQVLDLILYLKCHYIYPEMTLSWDKLLPEQAVFVKMKLTNRREVLKYMSEKLIEDGIVPEGYVRMVNCREEYVDYVIGNEIAVPYLTNVKAARSFIEVMTLQQPILWNKKKVSVIFHIVLREEDLSNLPLIFERIYEISRNRKLLEQVKNADKSSVIRQILV